MENVVVNQNTKGFFQSLFPAITPSSWNAAGKSPSMWCGLHASLTSPSGIQKLYCHNSTYPKTTVNQGSMFTYIPYISTQISALNSHKQTDNKQLTHSLTHHPTDQPTNSMEQSPSWEANRFSASKESPCILNSLTKYVCHSESNASYLFPLKLQQIQGAQ